MAKTRHRPGSAQQSYGNCGIEAWRSIINRARAARGEPPLSEDQALQRALDLGVAGNTPQTPKTHGSTTVGGRVALLGDQGMAASEEPGTDQNIQQFVGEGRAVGVSVDPYWYWPEWAGAQPGMRHQIQVTGVEFDGDGKVNAYIVSDSGIGECALRIPAYDFPYARYPDAPLTVSKHPVR